MFRYGTIVALRKKGTKLLSDIKKVISFEDNRITFANGRTLDITEDDRVEVVEVEPHVIRYTDLQGKLCELKVYGDFTIHRQSAGWGGSEWSPKRPLDVLGSTQYGDTVLTFDPYGVVSVAFSALVKS